MVRFGGKGGQNSGRKGEEDKGLIRDFGQNVARLRKWRGIRQGSFSDMLGISRATMSNIENGYQNITLTMAYRISQALGLPPASLFASDHIMEQDELDQMAHIRRLQARNAELEALLGTIEQLARRK